jgi:ABC-type multidrug transport system ATPase subunit
MNKKSSLKLFFILLVTTCSRACDLIFQVTTSPLNFYARVTSPISSSLNVEDDDMAIGLQGTLLLSFDGDCPDSPQDLQSILTDDQSSISVKTTSDTGPLQLYPSVIPLSGIAQVDWYEAAFNITGNLDELTAIVSEGYVLTTSLLSRDPDRVEIIGINGTTPILSTAAVNGSTVELSLADFNVKMTSVFLSELAGQPLRGVNDYYFEGMLNLRYAAGSFEEDKESDIENEKFQCGPGGCGSNGRCIQFSDPETGEERSGCQCKCGWSGVTCSVINNSGYCSSVIPGGGGQVGGVNCPTSPPAPAPSPAAIDCSSLLPPSQECKSAREKFNPATQRCECIEGWTGPGCAACSSDIACSELFRTAATCSDNNTYTEHSAYKAYTCDLFGTGLDDVIVPGTFWVACNATGSLGISGTDPTAGIQGAFTGGDQGQGQSQGIETVPPEESYCEVSFSLQEHANNPISCKADMCTFTLDTTVAECRVTTCACERECTDVQGVLDKINGNPCTISCDDTTGECTFDIQDFFVKLVAPCTAQVSECLVQAFSLSSNSYIYGDGSRGKSLGEDVYNPIIAAIPLMVLTLTAVFLAVYLYKHRSFLKSVDFDDDDNKNVMILSNGGGEDGTVDDYMLKVAAEGEGGGGGGIAGEVFSSSVELSFRNLSCAVPITGHSKKVASAADVSTAINNKNDHIIIPTRKIILDDVSGVVRSRELIGIMGPSGSGKSTLLGLLSSSPEDVSSSAIVSGHALLDGAPLTSAASRHRVAFVPQSEALLPTLTVEETLRVAALLRLPGTVDPEILNQRIGRVIKELGLTGVAHSRIGSGGGFGGGAGGGGRRGLSGGEQRRVTIGVSMITNPEVLLLDEPTSGLDSYNALQLMKTLRQLADRGRIVMLSFHQPSPAMFNLLDKVYLLSKGRRMYAGSPGGADEMLAAAGLPCPVGTAMAEHLLEVTSDPKQLPLLSDYVSKKKLSAIDDDACVGSSGSSDGGVMSSSNKEGGNSPLQTRLNSRRVGHAPALPPSPPPPPPSTTTSNNSTTSFTETRQGKLSRRLAVLFWRTAVDIIRNPTLLLLHWAMSLAMGVFVGCIFWQVGLDISGAQNRAGGLFFALAFFAFTSLTTVDLLVNEKRLVGREVGAGCYGSFEYLITKACLDGLLLRVIPALLYAAPFYPMMGLGSGSSTVALFLMVLSLFALTSGALSLGVAVVSKTPGQAALIMNVVLLISLLVGGFFVNATSMPSWIRWLRYLSVFYYGYTALITNEMVPLLLDFVVEGYTAVRNVRGTTFLNIIGVDPSDLTEYIGILVGMYFGFLVLAYLALIWRTPRGKRIQ